MDDSSLLKMRELVSDFPYFSAARMLFLRNLKNIDSYKLERELENNAVFIPDRSILYKLLNIEDVSKPDEFVDNSAVENDIEVRQTGKAVSMFAVSPAEKVSEKEVAAIVEKKDPLDEIIEQFIEKQPTITKKKVVSEKSDNVDLSVKSSTMSDDLITETLAKIYITQGFYEKAIEAYSKLSLKFPEKNSYFAAQIEEVKKLI